MTGFDVGARHVGDGAPCLIVAEVAQAHEGSLQMAHAYIDAIAGAGADAVKFQAHYADYESTRNEEWRIEPKHPQDTSRFNYWLRMQFTREQWASLARHSADRGLIFLCSPFSEFAVTLLDPFVPAWKVASGEVTHKDLLYAIHKTVKPVILSSGMATADELSIALRLFLDSPARIPVALLHCTSMYPCPPEMVGLDRLVQHGAYPIGISDHSGTIWPSIGAATLGASIIEVHVKLSKHDQGFDASSSVTVEELRQLVEGVRFVEKARRPADEDARTKALQPIRSLFMDRRRRRADA